jgi:hypothetical protein
MCFIRAFPSYVAEILNSVKEIDFYVLCNKHINYAERIEKFIVGKPCTFKLLEENSFLLTSGCDTVLISIEARLIHGRLAPGLIVAPSALKMRLSSLAYGVVCIKNV